VDSLPGSEQIIEVAVDYRHDISGIDCLHAPALFSKSRRSRLFIQKNDDGSVGMLDVNVGRFVFITSQDGDSKIADA